MKRKIIAVTVLMAAFIVGGMVYLLYIETGGFRYRSSGVTNMSIEIGDSDSATYSFGMMKGNKVFRLKYDGHEGGCIRYSGKLDSGKLTVSYDDDGTKKELFVLESGGAVDNARLELKEKGPVYIIIETDGRCEGGKFEFEIQ